MAYQHTLSPGTVLNGEYRIQRVLGSGGFANTYLATDLSLNREVAIKEYFPSDISIRVDGSSVRVKAPSYESHFTWGLERFVREAKTLAKFRHPNIVRVFRTFDANDTAYTVLDFVKGADMEAWLKALGRRPSQKEFDRLLGPILDALTQVHDAGILHRDIKPANIYIRAEDQQPVLLDFGAARYAVGELTGTTAAIVSRGYSPHEAYATDNKLQGPWTDIYGVAATMHRALSGEEPTESTLRVLEDTLVPASQMRLPERAYRSNFLHSIDWGLSVLPNNRPRSAEEWRVELFQGASAVSSNPLSNPTRPGRSGQPTGPRSAGNRPTAPRSGGRASAPDTTPGSGPRQRSRSGDNAAPSAGRPASTGRPSSDRWGLPPGAENPSRPKPSELLSETEARRSQGRKSGGFMAAAAIACMGLAGIGVWQMGLLENNSSGGSSGTAPPTAAIESSTSTQLADTANREREEAAARVAKAQAEAEAEQRRQRAAAEQAKREEAARLEVERREAARQQDIERARLAAIEARRQAEQRAREQAEQEALAQQLAEAETERRAVAEQKARDEAERERKLTAEADRLRKMEEERKRRIAEDRAREAAEKAAAQRREREATRLAMLTRQREIEEARRRAEEARDKREAAERAAKEAAARKAKEEAERAEAARQAKLEAERAEAARQAKLEAERAEAARQAKLEAERAEAARQAKLDAERAEAARQAKLDAERAEAARQAKLEAERAEAARQAKLDAERAELARKEKEEAERKQRLAAQEVEEDKRIAALAAPPAEEQRETWIKEIQTQLKQSQCHQGDIDGQSPSAQASLDRFGTDYRKGSSGDYRTIRLATANVGEFNQFLGWFRSKRSFRCPFFERDTQEAAPVTKPRQKQTTPTAKPKRQIKRKAKPRRYTKPRTKKKKVYRAKSKTRTRSSSNRSPSRPERVGGSR